MTRAAASPAQRTTPITIAAIDPVPRAEPLVDEDFETGGEDDVNRDLLDAVVIGGKALDGVRNTEMVA